MPQYEKRRRDGNIISDPLQEKGIIINAAANTTTPLTFTSPSERGDILGVQLFVDNTAPADLIASSVTLAANGVNFYEDVPLMKYATLYQNSNNEFYFFVANGGQATVSVKNGSGNAIKVFVNFLFRPINVD